MDGVIKILHYNIANVYTIKKYEKDKTPYEENAPHKREELEEERLGSPL